MNKCCNLPDDSHKIDCKILHKLANDPYRNLITLYKNIQLIESGIVEVEEDFMVSVKRLLIRCLKEDDVKELDKVMGEYIKEVKERNK